MADGSGKLIFWAPRVLGSLLAVFLGLFALDVFGEGTGFWQTLGALLVHLVPVYVVAVVLAVAWRWEGIGGILFIALAVSYLLWTRGRFDWLAYLAVSGPLFLTGILFLASWRLGAKGRLR